MFLKMKGKCTVRGENNMYKPPCAGITLIRFCGYILSLTLRGRRSTPGNTEVNAAKLG
jgi:hypothetical protein